MALDYRGEVSIVELMVYSCTLFTSIYLSSRHGLGRNAGWIFLALFSLVRIIGASCQLAKLSTPSAFLLTATTTLDSLGLACLLFASLGLLSCVFNPCHKTTCSLKTINANAIIFGTSQLLITTGLVLCVVGGSTANLPTVITLTKASIVLYIFAFIFLSLATFFTTLAFFQSQINEKRLVLAVAVSLPWICGRLIYSALAAFANNPRFNVATGSISLFLVMAVLEEFCVVIAYLVAGISLKISPTGQEKEHVHSKDGTEGPWPRPTSMKSPSCYSAEVETEL